ncbi:phage holin family protein [Ornithinimicrobium cavernae]|uniref:phage holin family protein n=1 Tax=Ornithinimicrobium cavernae TaxID=2666047 RepID=UPI000D69E93F|nr:phage holin family protein [Ornithinimicrobium cavernae]
MTQGTPDQGRPLSSVGEIVSDISQNLSTLIRQETELAKAELRESTTRAGKGAGLLGGAGVAGHFVLLFLSLALWWWIGDGTGLGWSALIVALIWAVAAAVLAALGRSRLKEVRGMPRTTSTAKRIPDALKGKEETR